MSYTLTLLGTDTVYIPDPQDLKLVSCIAECKLPEILEKQAMYITEFKKNSFRYTLLDPEGKPVTGRVYARDHFWFASRFRALMMTGGFFPLIKRKLIGGNPYTDIYIPVDSFTEELLTSYKPFIIDIAAGKGRAVKVDYPRGETLSFIASVMNRREKVEPNITHQAEEQAVIERPQVVEGPETFGTDIGIKIRDGLLKLVAEIAKGETELNIVAHSRGAVESILIANELERLRSIVDNSETDPTRTLDYQSLIDSPCPYTKKAFVSFFKAPHNQALLNTQLAELSNKIKSVALNLFNIDPVPGDDDNIIALGANFPLTDMRLRGLSWKDPRFFNIPPIVKHYVVCIKENEHTRLFKPIIAKAQDPAQTKFELFTLPGHHGTASGSPYDQTQAKSITDPTFDKRYDVQNIMICKIANFLLEHGESFQEATDKNKELQSILSKHLSLDTVEKREENLLNYYEEIYKNWDEYKLFNTTAYGSAVMLNHSVHNTFSIDAWRNGVDRQYKRIVHCHSHNDSYLSDHVSAPSDRFINTEHANLFMKIRLSKTLGKVSATPPTQRFCNFIQQIALQDNESTNEIRTNILAAAKQTNSGSSSIFKDAFQTIISSIASEYLQGKLTEEDKLSIIESLRTLAKYNQHHERTEDAPDGDFAVVRQELSTFSPDWILFVQKLTGSFAMTLDQILNERLNTFNAEFQQIHEHFQQINIELSTSDEHNIIEIKHLLILLYNKTSLMNIDVKAFHSNVSLLNKEMENNLEETHQFSTTCEQLKDLITLSNSKLSDVLKDKFNMDTNNTTLPLIEIFTTSDEQETSSEEANDHSSSRCTSSGDDLSSLEHTNNEKTIELNTTQSGDLNALIEIEASSLNVTTLDFSQTIDTNISMQILGGFIATLGVAAIAIAFTILNAATLGIPGVALAVSGVVMTLMGYGIFKLNQSDNESPTTLELQSTGITL